MEQHFHSGDKHTAVGQITCQGFGTLISCTASNMNGEPSCQCVHNPKTGFATQDEPDLLDVQDSPTNESSPAEPQDASS